MDELEVLLAHESQLREAQEALAEALDPRQDPDTRVTAFMLVHHRIGNVMIAMYPEPPAAVAPTTRPAGPMSDYDEFCTWLVNQYRPGIPELRLTLRGKSIREFRRGLENVRRHIRTHGLETESVIRDADTIIIRLPKSTN